MANRFVAVGVVLVVALSGVAGLLLVPQSAEARGPRAHVRSAFRWVDEFGTSGEDFAEGTAVDASGIYAGGFVQGTLPGETSAGSYDAFVRKYDSRGNVVWTTQFGTSGSDNVWVVALDATGVYVAGGTSGAFTGFPYAGGGSDGFLAKFDRDGYEVWIREFGSTGYDDTFGIGVDGSGIYVGGQTGGSLFGQPYGGGMDAFLLKYDGSGNQLWAREFGSASDDDIFALAAGPSGVFVGGIIGSLSGTRAFVRAYDADGRELWTDLIEPVPGAEVTAAAVDGTSIYVAGSAFGAFPGETWHGALDGFVRAYDVNGAVRWTREFGTPEYELTYALSADASAVYVGGSTMGVFPGQTSGGNLGVWDGYYLRYDPGGSLVWTQQFGTPLDDQIWGGAVDQSGNLYGVGSTMGAFPGQTNAGDWDAFLASVQNPKK